jgi:hypothetical protein
MRCSALWRVWSQQGGERKGEELCDSHCRPRSRNSAVRSLKVDEQFLPYYGRYSPISFAHLQPGDALS